jgi:hypothetical protein
LVMCLVRSHFVAAVFKLFSRVRAGGNFKRVVSDSDVLELELADIAGRQEPKPS